MTQSTKSIHAPVFHTLADREPGVLLDARRRVVLSRTHVRSLVDEPLLLVGRARAHTEARAERALLWTVGPRADVSVRTRAAYPRSDRVRCRLSADWLQRLVVRPGPRLRHVFDRHRQGVWCDHFAADCEAWAVRLHGLVRHVVLERTRRRRLDVQVLVLAPERKTLLSLSRLEL